MRRLKDLGKFRQTITISKPSRDSDGAGGFETTMSSLGEFKAYIAPVASTEKWWDEQLREKIVFECWVRYDERIAQGDVVSYDGESYFVSRAFDPSHGVKEFTLMWLREGDPL